MSIYLHIRVLLGIILGLGIGHLLRGVASIVEHPSRYKVYWVHMLWTLFLFIYLVHFWWWEFALANISPWTFPIYFFVAAYGTLIYFLCTLLFPADLSDYGSYRVYFYSRKHWFFGLLALLFVADIGDTFIKGSAYRQMLGLAYDIRTSVYILFFLLAIRIKNARFHAVFAVAATVYEIVYILTMYLRAG